MKFLKPLLLTLLVIFIFTSCSSVRVSSDYDIQADFKDYKTFAFYKKGIDNASISDLDKKRIMRAIEDELQVKGYKISSDPDILVSIFTKSREKVNVNNSNISYGWGWGWNRLGWAGNPWYWNNQNIRVDQYTEGTLFIDFIDKNGNELVWQGIGSSAMKMKSAEKKEERIKEFVKEILSEYPPGNKSWKVKPL